MLRGLGLGLLGLVAVVALVAGVALLLLHTGWAERKIAAVAREQVEKQLAGKLKLGSVRVRGLLEVCARDVDLRDPDGHPALAAKEICVSLDGAALVRQLAQISKVSLVEPVIDFAELPGAEPGTITSTLLRALAARVPSSANPSSGPSPWKVVLERLDLTRGKVILRHAPGAAPWLALEGLELPKASARWAATAAAVKLSLSSDVTAPGALPLKFAIDARLDGDAASGTLALTGLSVQLGGSGFTASGRVELGALRGELKLRTLRLEPKDVATLLRGLQPGEPVAVELAGPIAGEADLSSTGTEAKAALRLQAGGGALEVDATATLAKPIQWTAKIAARKVDPAGVVTGAPQGEISLLLEARGRGVPEVSASGASGEVQGTLHLGPARLDRVGPISAELDASLLGSTLTVKKLEAEALTLSVKGKGAAGREALSLDLDARAGDLAAFARALAILEHQPALHLSGSGRLTTRITGSLHKPDAEVHLHAPALGLGGLSITALAVDGTLHGSLKAPRGQLVITSTRLAVGDLDLGASNIRAGLEWPVAKLSIDAAVRAVKGAAGDEDGNGMGHFTLEGNASIDEDRDGLVLSAFRVAWPGNELKLEKITRVHLRPRETVLEPLRLAGEHGAIGLAATVVHAKAGAGGKVGPDRIEAALSIDKFDLARLPRFLLPSTLDLAGSVDANVGVTGVATEPEVDLQAALHGVRVQQLSGLEGKLHAQLHQGRLRAGGTLDGLLGTTLSLRASLPLQSTAPESSPVELDLTLGPLSLEAAAKDLRIVPAVDAGAKGSATVKLFARGTLAAPRADLTLELTGLAWKPLHDLTVVLKLATEQATAHLTGKVELAGAPVLTLDAREPFDLATVLHQPALLAHLFERPGSAVIALWPGLDLAVLAKGGLLAPGSSGALSGRLELGGTPALPELKLEAKGVALASGPLHGLDFTFTTAADRALRASLVLQAGDAAGVKLRADAAISAAELVAAARMGFARATLDPLLQRKLALALEVEHVVIGKAAELAGATPPLLGTVDGKVEFEGTADAPVFQGRLSLTGLEVRGRNLGGADVWVEGDKEGAVAHLGLTPPGAATPSDRKLPVTAAVAAAKGDAPHEQGEAPAGAGAGTVLLHASLHAPLSATAVLDGGTAVLLEGRVDLHLLARKLDLAFLSGLVPGLRRTAGTFDADLEVQGVLGDPVPQGEAHLAGGFFDVVGQGLFEDVAFDATLSPKEIVLDRLTGSSGGGPFSGVLVLGRRKAAEGAGQAPLEFTGELHFGDAEAVRDRLGREGKPLGLRSVPLRQAGEERADFTAEVDLFGEYEDGTLTATVKIPRSSVHVRALPDKKLPSLEPNPEVMAIHPGKEPTPAGVDPVEAAAQEKRRRAANLRVDLNLELDELRVSADDFDFSVTSNLHASWDAQHPEQPSADGTVEIPHGSFSALGRRFEIEHATITETGGDIADPELEVQARYINPQATVLVIVSGTAKDPQIDLSSSPAMDQDAIAFFLATGRLQGRATQQGGGVDLSNAASSALGGMLFGELRKQMADVMPVDVLTIEAGGGGRPAQASLGKYIGDRFFVGYRQRLTPSPNENTSEGRVEYEILRGLGAEATVGEKNRDVSILYTKDF